MRACQSLGEAAATSHCPQSYPARNCSYRDLPWCQRSINHRPNGFRANSFLVVAAIVDVGVALIVPLRSSTSLATRMSGRRTYASAAVSRSTIVTER
jgi:hypothetical protein